MIVIILAGGYAKRLWPLSVDTPKPLLPIAGKPAIDYILEAIKSLGPRITKPIILTNERFKQQFRTWATGKELTKTEVISDGSHDEEDKPGAIGALAAVEDMLADETLIVAGNNLITASLQEFINYFDQKRAPVVALYHASEQTN